MQDFLLILIFWFLITSAIAPIESLGWFAGWFERTKSEELGIKTIKTKNKKSNHFIIYLSGIGAFTHDSFTDREIKFLKALEDLNPDIIFIKNIYPYSLVSNYVSNTRLMRPFWNFVVKMRKKRNFIGNFINWRNMVQVAVSTDKRYGPFYNRGNAEIIIDCIKSYGFDFNKNSKITIISYSGGTQIAIGAYKYLKELISNEIKIISIGGVFSSDESFYIVDKFINIYSFKDNVYKLTKLMFPGRWIFLRESSWNKASRSKRVKKYVFKDMLHNSKNGYLDGEITDVKSNIFRVIKTINNQINS